MCFFCSLTHPNDPLAGYDQHIGTAGSSSSGSGGGITSAPFTWDQIAGQLTDGYWNFNGGAWRAFDLDATRTLTYDIANLSAPAQTIALAAMEAWSEVTGITFVAVATPITSVVIESSDASGSTATAYTIGSTMTSVTGSIGVSYDVDYYRVSLVAGQTYMIATQGPAIDLILRLMNSAGSVIEAADFGYDGEAEYIIFTATTTGTHYISVEEWGAFTGSYALTIEQVTADITFNDMDPSGAYAWSDLSGNQILRSFININDSWSPLNLNGYMLQTYIHELGHALGLGHAGNYNTVAIWPNNALYDNDSWAASIMSYFSQTDNTNFAGSLANLATVMPADIIAIQNLYGFSGAANGGNTTYGFNSNMGGYLQDLLNMWTGAIAIDPFVYAGRPIAFTIFDSNGIDTVDFSNFAVNQTINLNQLTYSSVGGFALNMIIARDVVIENATGGSGNDTIIGNAANNSLAGGLGFDLLDGGAGDDILNGRQGDDTMIGGAGNDTYVVDSAGDQVFETTTTVSTTDAGGIDTVRSSVSFNLDAHAGVHFVENLVPTGTANLNGNGNALGNSLIGNAGNNALNGRLGDDTMIGGAGNDTYFVSSTDDLVFETKTTTSTIDAGGIDTVRSSVTFNLNAYAGVRFVENLVLTGMANINGTGNTLANRLTGNAGNNVLNGGVGSDVMIGGAGNDTYVVDATGDRVYETTTTSNAIDAGGIDTVRSSVSFNLDVYAGVRFVENMVLTGAANIDGTGNTLANRLSGNAGNNLLNGGLGNDVMIGGAGNDTYVVDSTSDRVYETTSTTNAIDAGGIDTVQSSVTFDLNAYAGVRFVENLVLTGTANINGTGNALGNRLTGNAGNNALNGGLGNDLLTGGAGNDTFVFNTTIGVGNVDRITDFNVVDDTIRLDDAVFVGLATGILAASAFAANLTGQAATALERIIYETDTGRLFFDSDGVGGTARVQFATLGTGLALTNADFFVF